MDEETEARDTELSLKAVRVELDLGLFPGCRLKLWAWGEEPDLKEAKERERVSWKSEERV